MYLSTLYIFRFYTINVSSIGFLTGDLWFLMESVDVSKGMGCFNFFDKIKLKKQKIFLIYINISRKILIYHRTKNNLNFRTFNIKFNPCNQYG